MVNKLLVGAAAGIGISVFGIILGWGIFPPVVRSQVNEQVILKKGTEQWGRWEKIPQALDFKVYIFNVTNAEAVQRGAKPIVQEVGPYVYKQYRWKNVSRISRDFKSIKYIEMQHFVFDKEESAPFTQDDNIVVLNMALNSVLQVAEETMASFLGAIDGFLPDVFGIDPLESMFMQTTPRKFLFDGFHFCKNLIGPSEIVCDEIRKKNTKTIHVMEDNSLKFAFFKHKNGSFDGVYEVYSGVEDISKLTQILKFDEMEALSLWNTTGEGSTFCNMINGTDASSYPPNQPASGPLYIFNSDICRSVHLEFTKKETYKGIEGYKFIPHPDFLQDIGPEYSTECFCINKIFKGIVKPNGCMYKGALDMSTCLGAPVVLTMPHMVDVDPIYSNTIQGLNPDESKHEIFLNIEPNTGYPLEGRKRVQFNMFLRKVESIKITENLATSLLPVVWIEEGVALNDDMIQLLNTKLFNILMVLNVFKWCLIIGGIVLFLVCILWYFWKQNSNDSVIKVIS